MAVPETAEEVAAAEQLDSKLGAFFQAEMADQQADTPSDDGPAAETAEPEASEPQPEPEAEPEVEAEAEAEKPEPPRDDAGRFLPHKFTDPEIQGLVEKYGGDVNQALKAAVEAQRLIGRQGQELGELRKQMEETLEQRLTQFQQQTQQAQYAPSMVQSYIDDGNYYAAAETARQTGNQALLGHVLSSWGADSPYEATVYTSALQQQEFARQIEERLGQFREMAQPITQITSQQKMGQALTEFSEGKPDMQQVAPEMLKVAEQSPTVVALLAQDDPQVRAEVLDYLYTKARARIGDTLATAKQNADAQAQDEARQAKQQATVGSSATGSQAKPKSKQDTFMDEFRKVLFDDSTSIRSGLTTD